jgi:hypothetical protein
MRSSSTLGDGVVGVDVHVEDEACVDDGGEEGADAENVDAEDDEEEVGVVCPLSALAATLIFLVGAGWRSTLRVLL